MDKKLIDIETTLAHHDQQIAEMNDVITDQWKQIDNLKAVLARLGDKIEQAGHDRDQNDPSLSSIEKARREIPPHF
jgi:SlyX protein